MHSVDHTAFIPVQPHTAIGVLAAVSVMLMLPAIPDNARPRRLAVIGAGFVGAEVASTARSLGLDVTLIDLEDAPPISAATPSAAAARR